jgi:hypothetical protein
MEMSFLSISQLVLHLPPSMNVTLCYTKLPTPTGFSMINPHQLQICFVAPSGADKSWALTDMRFSTKLLF